MKLRIKDNAVRFRITLKELEELRSSGCIERRTRVPGAGGEWREFRYAAMVDTESSESRMELGAFEMVLVLGRQDFETLCDPENEGTYVRNEWRGPDGEWHRFMAFIEKDRPGSACVKPEEWIYEEIPGRRPLTRPIPGKAGVHQD